MNLYTHLNGESKDLHKLSKNKLLLLNGICIFWMCGSWLSWNFCSNCIHGWVCFLQKKICMKLDCEWSCYMKYYVSRFVQYTNGLVEAQHNIIAYHNEAERKWLPFCRQHFQTYFILWKFLFLDSNLPKFVPKGPIDDNLGLVQTIALHRTGNKPFIWTNKGLAIVYWCIYASLGLDELSQLKREYICGIYSWFYFALFCHDFIIKTYWFPVIHLTISFRVTSLALGQSYDCPNAGEVTLKYIGKINWYQIKTKHNKAWTVCIILGMYWLSFALTQWYPLVWHTYIYICIRYCLCWWILA